MVRSTCRPFATGRCELIELVACRPSITCATMLWASGWVGWPRDAAGGLLQKEEAARAPEARSWRLLRSWGAALVLTTSAVAEGVRASTLGVDFGRAHNAVALCARAVQEPTLEARGASELRRR